MDQALLQIDRLTTVFQKDGRRVKAVDSLSLSVMEGEILALVGESGSGKSALCHSVMGLLPRPEGRIGSGRILFNGTDLLTLDEREMRQVRGAGITLVAQSAASSLNPALKISSQMVQTIRCHQKLDRKKARETASQVLSECQLPDTDKILDSYPDQLSGGMKQRVMIALALCCRSRLLIADEPTSSLDAPLQNQILDLLSSEVRKRGSSLLLVSHDLALVSRYCDRVAVMYAGNIVEEAGVEELFLSPRHPYTKALLASTPRIDGPRQKRLETVTGQMGTDDNQQPGCPFHKRCPKAEKVCTLERPSLVETSPGHRLACLLEGQNGQ